MQYSFTTGRPTVFVDTPMKVGNPDWRDIGLEPTDISLRNQIGRSVAVDQIGSLGEVARSMVARPEHWRRVIEDVYDGFVFNHGHGGEVAGRYLLDAVLSAQARRTGAAGAKPAAGDTAVAPAATDLKEGSREA